MKETLFSEEHNWPGRFPMYKLYEIPKGSIELDFFAYMYTRDMSEAIVAPCSGNTSPHTPEHQKTSTQSKIIQTDKNIIFITWAQHYWHFHGETVAQILLYETLDIFKKYSPENTLIVTHGNNLKYRQILAELFKNLNLGDYEMVESKRGECCKTSKTLVTTTNMIMGGTVPPPWLYLPINARVNQLNYTSTQEIVFLSREDANYRKLLNEAELLSALQKEYKVDVYEFSKVSYSDQVRLMNTSKVVIQISGTHGINNMYINPKNTKVLILSPEAYTGRGTDILNKLKADYRLVKATKEEFTFDHKDMRRAAPHNNFYIDANEVLANLKELLCR